MPQPVIFLHWVLYIELNFWSLFADTKSDDPNVVFLDVEVDLSVISGIANTFSLDNKISMDANAKVRPHHSRWDRHFKMVALESRAKDRDVLNVRYPLQKVAFSPVEPSVNLRPGSSVKSFWWGTNWILWIGCSHPCNQQFGIIFYGFMRYLHVRCNCFSIHTFISITIFIVFVIQ